MTLVRTEEMLLNAQKGKYAVGAFNVENMEMVIAAIEAAEELNSPIILQTTPSTVKYAGVEMYAANVAALAKQAKVPVALHLDHGDSFELAMQAMCAGYTSIMFDGSHGSYEDNLVISQAVVRACQPNKIGVEGELGKIGGKEDDLDGGDGGLTDPEQARDYVEKTGINSLAVAIGTVHGIYKGEPNIDLERLKAIRKLVEVPLVLHGTSGVPDETVRECIKEGICKVNYATDLRVAFSKGVKQVLNDNPNTIDPKKYGMVGREEVKQNVKDKIQVVGSVNKAV